jgi:NADPH:quinone reductase-like Zn-dependent oxidoreductase
MVLLGLAIHQFGVLTLLARVIAGIKPMDFLRRSQLKAGERILIVGASGTVGSALVQLAVHRGAQVTAVTSTANLERVQALGVQHVIDYTQHDIRQSKESFDVIADAVGTLHFQTAIPMLSENGRFLAINGGISDMLAGKRGSRRCIAGPARVTREALETLVQLAVDGHFRPLIDRVVAFSDLPAAHARADSGRKTGSVVVKLP